MNIALPVDLKQEHVQSAVLFANRTASLSCWPRHTRVAEIGTAFGAFASLILRDVKPTLLDIYDTFNLHQIETLWGKPSADTFKGRSHREFYESRFSSEIASGVMRVFQGDSSAEIAKRDNGFYDLIYVDGNHSYDGVLKDATASIPTLKPDGLLVFNDYVYYDKQGKKYGVMNVVNDLCVNQGWTVKYLALQREMFCDVALARKGEA